MRKSYKSSEARRFSQSALLFRFCLHVLQTRTNNFRIHDQEVGNILSYNPSDTSHWKRGKKAVRSIYALKALSKKLDVDLDIIQSLADGTTQLKEALFDFSEAEEEKKRFHMLDSTAFLMRRERAVLLEKIALDILAQANIKTIPVYMPEVVQALPFLQLLPGDVTDKLARSSRSKPGQYIIRFKKGELRAHTRTAIAREVARIILHSERDRYSLPERHDLLSFYEVQDFSNSLLVPSALLKSEIQKISINLNLVQSLAETFWVSKSVIRSRLNHLLLQEADASVFTGTLLQIHTVHATGVPEFSAWDLGEDDQPSASAVYE